MCYSSGDKYDEGWRKRKKEWFPYDEYKKAKEEKFRQTRRGYYQKEQPPPEMKPDFDSMWNRFMEASEKMHDAIDSTLRNQQASIADAETQVGQLTQLVHERLIPKKSNPKPQPHVTEISIEKKQSKTPHFAM